MGKVLRIGYVTPAEFESAEQMKLAELMSGAQQASFL
jgi:hypothetical protein